MSNPHSWLLHLLFGPRRVAARAASWSWLLAWCVHALGLAIGGGALFGWTMVDEQISAVELANELSATPQLVDVLMRLVWIEIGFLVLGVGAAAWGAGSEKCSRSVAAAVKRLFALTPHVGVLFGVAWWLGWWYFGYWLDSRGEVYEVVGVLAVMGLVYYVAALWLSVVSAGRSRPRCRWPAQCEGCNYSLMHLDEAANCPECGLPVVRSRNAETRPGLWSGWRAGRLRSHSLWCLIHPALCGRAVQLFDPRQRPGRCLGRSVAGFGATVTAGMFLLVALNDSYSSYPMMENEGWVFVLGICLVYAGGIGLLVTAIELATASLIGWSAGRGVQRNLMPAALQLAVRMSGAWSFAAIAYMMGVGVLMLATLEWGFDLRAWSLSLGMDPNAMVFLLIFGPPLLFLLLWTVQLARATRAARFSNV